MDVIIAKAGDWVINKDKDKYELYTFNGQEWVMVEKTYLSDRFMDTLIARYAPDYGYKLTV